ncbi:protein NCBP2AS2 homolog [Amphiura filiformis]|uniref:protein NCBP2AS2 homolog n=1 Tax=Amphiura filiformis TaxID=82378 RepID=UPI003B20E678
MPLRSLLRYLVNNQQLVEKLADSRFMRRLAQVTVYGFNKAKEISHDAIEQASESETLKKFEQKQEDDSALGSFSKTFAKELRKGAKEMSEELKKRELKD